MSTPPPSHQARIDGHMALREYPQACALFQELQRDQPLTLAQTLQWSEAAKSMQALDRALAILEDYAGREAPDAAFHIAQGKLHRDLGRHQSALEHYQRALRVDPACAMAHCQRGIVFEVLERFDEASDCYRKALELEPGSGMYWLGLAKCLRVAGETEAAMEAFAAAERHMVDETDYNRACLYALMGRAPRALELLGRFCHRHAFAADWARQDPDLASLRDEPGFEAALRGEPVPGSCTTPALGAPVA